MNDAEDRTDWQIRMGVGERQSRYHRHRGASRTRKIARDDKPGVAGTQTDHWDGRIDATALARPVTKKGTSGGAY